MTKQTNDQSLKLEKSFTKTEQVSYLTNKSGAARKVVGLILEGIEEMFDAHAKKGLPFSFIGLVKAYTADKAATAEREVPNPFNGKMVRYPAKPAHKVVRVKPLKKLKEMVD